MDRSQELSPTSGSVTSGQTPEDGSLTERLQSFAGEAWEREADARQRERGHNGNQPGVERARFDAEWFAELARTLEKAALLPEASL